MNTDLIKNKFGAVPDVKDFQNLLVNPILPSDLENSTKNLSYAYKLILIENCF